MLCVPAKALMPANPPRTAIHENYQRVSQFAAPNQSKRWVSARGDEIKKLETNREQQHQSEGDRQPQRPAGYDKSHLQ
jgi:hypothetical protein